MGPDDEERVFLGAFQVNRENFRLDLVYNNPVTGVDVNYIPAHRWTRSR
ncbi:MAG: hypothetical protein IPH05_12600 [Flavobacteriales bacterium]|nr:hypothetical protein [Flavobacteriales bacterium]